MDYAVQLWRDNAPEDSLSGTPEGLMRRAGRRDAAAGLVARVMMCSESDARQALEHIVTAAAR